jgi:hypothetical protein
VEKGNGTFAFPSAAMITDQTQPWLTNFHEILTKEAGKLEDQRTFLSPFSRIPFSRHGGQRRMYVRIP